VNNTDPANPTVAVSITSQLDMNGQLLTDLTGNLQITTTGATGTISLTAPGTAGTITLNALGNPDGNIGLTAYSNVSLTANHDQLVLTTIEGDIIIDAHTDIRQTAGSNMSLAAYNDVGITSTNANIILASPATVSVVSDYASVTAGTDISLSAGGQLSLFGNDIGIGTNATATIVSTCTDYMTVTALNGPIDIQATGTGTINLLSENDLLLSAGGAISTTSGSVSMTTNTGTIELHANGSNLVLASGSDAVSISSGGGDNVSITAGGGGLILTTDGDLVMNGTGIQDTSVGLVSGKYLRIKLNNIYYKIQLLYDT